MYVEGVWMGMSVFAIREMCVNRSLVLWKCSFSFIPLLYWSTWIQFILLICACYYQYHLFLYFRKEYAVLYTSHKKTMILIWILIENLWFLVLLWDACCICYINLFHSREPLIFWFITCKLLMMNKSLTINPWFQGFISQ